MMIPRTPTHIPVDVTVVAAKRLPSNLIHIRYVAHQTTKVTRPIATYQLLRPGPRRDSQLYAVVKRPSPPATATTARRLAMRRGIHRRRRRPLRLDASAERQRTRSADYVNLVSVSCRLRVSTEDVVGTTIAMYLPMFEMLEVQG